MQTKPTSNVPSDGPEAISDPILSDLYSYWALLRKSSARRSDLRTAGTGKRGLLPLRSDLDPIDIPHLLPYIALVECSEGGRSIRFRLVGTDVAFGSDPTGRFLHEEAPEGPYRNHITQLYYLGANSREGLYSEFSYGYTSNSGPKLIKRLFLPLIGTAEVPTMMLVGQVRDKSAHAEQSAWQAAPGHINERLLFVIDPGAAESSDFEASNRNLKSRA
ncbi:PAS domain-containing protein [Pelagibius sp. Alg239-R121]|uniref:PAS domain-containing protein n=1 Tax=Pelagibius sp. Alg239-R121 TaxID=2993448 RepID=UPI0024A6DA7A|nr:PAS domain-containing protein [Pelagibius sp. Alg239-R121]